MSSQRNIAFADNLGPPRPSDKMDGLCFIRVSIPQEYWGTREHGQFQPGNNILGNKGTKNTLGNTGTKCSERGAKKKLCKRHSSCDISFALMSSTFVSKSVCMELRQWANWGISMSYEFTPCGWMLSEIINGLVGRRNTVVCEIAVTTYYTLNMAQANLGRIEGYGRIA